MDPTPTSWHGVTAIVMGNCGVGFAPADPGRREWLIQLMEGAEDIPGTALAEGMTWNRQTFPEYLDELDSMRRVLDIGALVPHGAVRAYVMGERGAHNGEATPEDIAAMGALVRQAVAARRRRVLDDPHDPAPGQGRRAGRRHDRVGRRIDRHRPGHGRGPATACSRWRATCSTPRASSPGWGPSRGRRGGP